MTTFNRERFRATLTALSQPTWGEARAIYRGCIGGGNGNIFLRLQAEGTASPPCNHSYFEKIFLRKDLSGVYITDCQYEASP